MTEQHWKTLIHMVAGLVMLGLALVAPFFGRWDVGTFFLVWACWFDLKRFGRLRD